VRLGHEVPLAAPAAEAWRELRVLPPARGSAAGYDGTAVLEDADDERRTATLRLQGAAGAATVAATATVTVLEGRLVIAADVRHGLGGLPPDEATAEDALGHLATTLAYALATAGRPGSAWDTSVPPAPVPGETWDTPSPLPQRPAHTPIPAEATLSPADAPPLAPPGPPADEPPSPLPAVVPAAGVPEVLTPRPRDVVHPGHAPAEEEGRGRWVKAGVVAAAGIAVLRILRGRR
jgi:hypothetical protein